MNLGQSGYPKVRGVMGFAAGHCPEYGSQRGWQARAALLAVDVEDIAENGAGLLIRIRSSKTDQEGEGVTIAIAPPCRCGVEAGFHGRCLASDEEKVVLREQ